MLKLELVPLYAALATYVPTAKVQSVCVTDDQCDKRYYCNEELYSCNKCVTCENFKQGDSCAKSIADCGSVSDCIDGYKFTKDGRCIPASTTSTIIVTAVSITVAVAVIVAGAVHVLRRRRYMISDTNPENGLNPGAIRATAPVQELEYMGDPPPSYNHINFERTSSPIICNDTKSMEPLLNSEAVEYANQPHTERMQRANLANPPRYVRLPDPPPNVNPQREEPPPPPLPPPASEGIPAVETQDPNNEENEEFVEQTHTTPRQPPLQITLNINNTNSANLLSIQQQEQSF